MTPPTGVRRIDFDALAEARHHDPFSILGPHVVDEGVVIRAFLPQAEQVSIIRPGGDAVPMQKRHDAGIFEGLLAGLTTIPDYALRVTHPGGDTDNVDDPYRYGRVLGDYDLYLFGEGNHTRIYDKLGAHPMRIGVGRRRALRGVGAQRRPRQRRRRLQPLGRPRAPDALARRERRLGDLHPGRDGRPALQVRDPGTQRRAFSLKADPYGLAFELPPLSASIVTRLDYDWQDDEWMRDRRETYESWFNRPMATYEVHLGSWARIPEEGNRYLTYDELAARLIPYVQARWVTRTSSCCR